MPRADSNEPGRGELPNDRTAPQLDHLAEDFLERLRQGEQPQISAFVERNPELAAQIRELFPLLEMLEVRPAPEPASDERALARPLRFPLETELSQRYVILELVGRGGMGEVYRARDNMLGREVAVKTLVAHRQIASDALLRFQREAKSLAALSHPNVLSLYDIGEHLGIPFVVMEFVRGQDLGRVAASGVLDPLRIAEIGEEIAAALAAAHEQGIVHRDIKPHNVFVLDDHRVKVLDFGLARLQDGSGGDEPQTITGTGVLPGTAAYMSPEQALGHSVGTATDIFALGTLLYEMLTGRNPFRSDSVFRTLQMIVEYSPPPASQQYHDLPAWFDELLELMLNKDPARRPTASAVRGHLREGRQNRLSHPLDVHADVPADARAGHARAAAARESAADDPKGTAAATLTHVSVAPQPERMLGEFELLSIIGSGGMAVVYRARQTTLGRDVALKCMRSGNDKWEIRFRREMQTLGAVKHPHLVEIFASGVVSGQSFYAMEYIDGADLTAICQNLTQSDSEQFDEQTWRSALTLASNAVRERERAIHHQPTLELDAIDADAELRITEFAATRLHQSAGYVQQMVATMLQVTEALEALHAAGIVHRDVKPSNIMLTRDGSRAVLIDPGIARLLDDTGDRLTHTHEVVGTLLYASPEQVLSVGTLDQRSDIYSLGATLWELLAFRPLFGGPKKLSRKQLMHCIEVEDPVSVRRYNRAVSPDLEAIVHKCLEKNPSRRYARASELASDLRRFLLGQPVTARPVGIVRRSCRTVSRRPVLMYGLGGTLLATAYGMSNLLPARFAALSGTPGRLTMNIGIKPWVGYCPLIVAHQMGWCEPLEMNLVPVTGLEDMRRLLDRRDIDVAMWLVDTHVLARSSGIATQVVLKLDNSLEADAVIAREEIRTFEDLVGKKVTYQHQEASHFLLLALCEKFGIDPNALDLQATTAAGAAERFVREPDIAAAASYDPHLFNALQAVPGSHRLVSGAEVPDAIVDILTVREDYLASGRESVELLLRGWFRAVEVLNDRRSPAHARAVAIACQFFDAYAPRSDGSAYGPEDYYKMSAGMRYGTLADNVKFFRVDASGSSVFRRQFSHAQERWGSHHQMGTPTHAADGDGSAILLELF